MKAQMGANTITMGSPVYILSMVLGAALPFISNGAGRTKLPFASSICNTTDPRFVDGEN